MNHISDPQESIEKAIQFLETNGITFERHDHPAVFTVDQVTELVSIEKGIRTKNLFVRDKKGRQHVLIVVPHDKAVDLMELGNQTGHGRVSFASPERIREEVGSILAGFGHGTGHVFNLGHGITPGVNPDNVTAFVDAVQELSPQYHQV